MQTFKILTIFIYIDCEKCMKRGPETNPNYDTEEERNQRPRFLDNIRNAIYSFLGENQPVMPDEARQYTIQTTFIRDLENHIRKEREEREENFCHLFEKYLTSPYKTAAAYDIQLALENTANINSLPWHVLIHTQEGYLNPLEIAIKMYEYNPNILITILKKVDLFLFNFHLRNYNKLERMLKKLMPLVDDSHEMPVLIFLNRIKNKYINISSANFMIAINAATKGRTQILNALLEENSCSLQSLSDALSYKNTLLHLSSLSKLGITQPFLKFLRNSTALSKVNSSVLNNVFDNIIEAAKQGYIPISGFFINHITKGKPEEIPFLIEKLLDSKYFINDIFYILTREKNFDIDNTLANAPHLLQRFLDYANLYPEAHDIISIILKKVNFAHLNLTCTQKNKIPFLSILQHALNNDYFQNLLLVLNQPESKNNLIDKLNWDQPVVHNEKSASLLYWIAFASLQCPQILELVLNNTTRGYLTINNDILSLFDEKSALYKQCKIHQFIIRCEYYILGIEEDLQVDQYMPYIYEQPFADFIAEVLQNIEKDKHDYSSKHLYKFGLLFYNLQQYEHAYDLFIQVPFLYDDYKKANEHIANIFYMGKLSRDDCSLALIAEDETERELRLLEALKHALLAGDDGVFLKNKICLAYVYGEQCIGKNESGIIQIIRGDYKQCVNTLKEMKHLVQIKNAYLQESAILDTTPPPLCMQFGHVKKTQELTNNENMDVEYTPKSSQIHIGSI